MDNRHFSRYFIFNKALRKTNKHAGHKVTGQQASVLYAIKILKGYSTANHISRQMGQANRLLHANNLITQLRYLSGLNFIVPEPFGQFNRYTITPAGTDYLLTLEKFMRWERPDK